MNRTLLSIVAVAPLCFALTAHAQEGEQAGMAATDPNSMQAPTEPGHTAEEMEPEAPEHAPSHLVIGAVGTGLVTTAFGDMLEINGSGGGGFFAEYTVVPNWLAIELDVRLLAAHEGDEFGGELPIDLLLKKPFEISEMLEAYIGIGATFVGNLHGGDHNAGIASVVGGYYWFADHAAIVAELDYNLLLAAAVVVQEVGISAGIALGF